MKIFWKSFIQHKNGSNIQLDGRIDDERQFKTAERSQWLLVALAVSYDILFVEFSRAKFL